MNILAIDQGTTSSRAMVYDTNGRRLAEAQRELRQIYPQPGWVEHDPEEIWSTVVDLCGQVLHQVGIDRVGAIGITNQRETTIIWERASGQALHNAIVWQDRRGGERCAALKRRGEEPALTARTGLLADSYFSATKAEWLLDRYDPTRERSARGELAVGTVDSFLVWRLTGGKRFVTDATNASRTMLFNIHEQGWDADLLSTFNVPPEILADVHDCADDFGASAPELFGRSLPITGIAGDQQAAVVGQACFSPGMIKATFGTGCFVLANTGSVAPASKQGLLTTVAYRLDGQVSYATEGSIFNAGTAVQWLRDQLGLLSDAADSESLAGSIEDTGGVYFVPAFTGLGAPWWDANARGTISGLHRESTRAALVRAALESVAYQLSDLMGAMLCEGLEPPTTIRVDGGMSANNWFMQFLADVLGCTVERPQDVESTARGAALLAGLGAGYLVSTDAIVSLWPEDRAFGPKMGDDRRQALIDGWHEAVNRALSATDP